MAIELDGGVGIDSPMYTGDGAGLSGIGTVLQVVYGSIRSDVTTTAIDSWVGSGCLATITPTSTSSKILVLGNIVSQVSGSDNEKQQNHGIKRDSTLIFGQLVWDEIRVTGGGYLSVRVPITYLDSPNTTSEITYELQGSLRHGSALSMQYQSRHDSTIILMEIAQ